MADYVVLYLTVHSNNDGQLIAMKTLYVMSIDDKPVPFVNINFTTFDCHYSIDR